MRVILDPCGILLIFVAWILLLISDLVVIKYVVFAWFSDDDPASEKFLRLHNAGIFILIAYNFSLFLCSISHMKAMSTDPGTIKEDVKVPPHLEAEARSCKICNHRWKPVRAHHCKLCKRCIFRMDHHCIWINNCVGMLNQKYFMLFLLYVALHAVLTLFLLAMGTTFFFQQPSEIRAFFNWWAAGSGTFTSITSAFFVFFCTDFLFEQIESIKTNTTLVETYQRVQGVERSLIENMVEVFGHDRWTWIWPVSPKIVPNYAEEVIPLPDDGDDISRAVAECGVAGDETEGTLEKKDKSSTTSPRSPDAPALRKRINPPAGDT